MMDLHDRHAEFRRVVPEWVSRAQLLEFVRSHCPDLRIQVTRVYSCFGKGGEELALEGGRRLASATFTMRGEHLFAQAAEGPYPFAPDTARDLSVWVTDIDDEIVRRCAWLVYSRLGIHRTLNASERRDRERAILEASERGDTEMAAQLGRELALLNEGIATLPPLRARLFEL